MRTSAGPILFGVVARAGSHALDPARNHMDLQIGAAVRDRRLRVTNGAPASSITGRIAFRLNLRLRTKVRRTFWIHADPDALAVY